MQREREKYNFNVESTSCRVDTRAREITIQSNKYPWYSTNRCLLSILERVHCALIRDIANVEHIFYLLSLLQLLWSMECYHHLGMLKEDTHTNTFS